jgi:aspartyl protease family protein
MEAQRLGHVTTAITISNPDETGRESTVEGLVDTGATFTVIPRRLASDLRLPVIGQRRVRTAAGEVMLDRARAIVQIDGQSEINPVLISDTLDRVLIGVITLETLSLTVDPTTGELNEAESLMF